MSFSDGGGEPSTHPFHPFFTATRRFRGCLGVEGGGEPIACAVSIGSKSSGVLGRLDDVREVLDESEGPGVDAGVDGVRIGNDGGGVTDNDRGIAGMCMAGRARQNDDVEAVGGWGAGGTTLLLLLATCAGV